MVAIVDGSFKKPGAIPFKWEIRPGVPRIQPEPQPQAQPLSPPALPPPSTPFQPKTTARPLSRSPSPIKRTITPPPLRNPTATSPLTRSQRRRQRQPELVSSRGCLPSTPSLLRRKAGEWSSDVGTVSGRWSVSSRRSAVFSPPPCSESPLSFSSSSWQSSPRYSRPVRDDDPEWGGFGLF